MGWHVLGSMLLIGLIFQLPRLTQLPSSLTTGVEELFFLAIALILNRDWPAAKLVSNLASANPAHHSNLNRSRTNWIIYVLNRPTTDKHPDPVIRCHIDQPVQKDLFRGMLFQASQSTLGVGRAAVFTSILFSLTHLINLGHQTLSLTLLQLGFTFVLGLNIMFNHGTDNIATMAIVDSHRQWLL